jgi:hypothetical protein
MLCEKTLSRIVHFDPSSLKGLKMSRRRCCTWGVIAGNIHRSKTIMAETNVKDFNWFGFTGRTINRREPTFATKSKKHHNAEAPIDTHNLLRIHHAENGTAEFQSEHYQYWACVERDGETTGS